jgi:tetratricopeptide (TPR) repeat protein
MVTLYSKHLIIIMKNTTKLVLFVALLGGFIHLSTGAEGPVNATELATQAQAALAAGDAKGAIKLYEKAIEADPNDPALMTDYANALTVRVGQVNFMAQGMIASKMLKAYKRSVEIDPNHVTGWIGQCRYYLNAPAIAGGSADKAEKYANEVMARVPFLGHVELGLVAEKRGDKTKAAEHFQAALDLMPDHGEAIAGLQRVTAES